MASRVDGSTNDNGCQAPYAKDREAAWSDVILEQALDLKRRVLKRSLLPLARRNRRTCTGHRRCERPGGKLRRAGSGHPARRLWQGEAGTNKLKRTHRPQSCRFTRAGTPGVTRCFLFRTLGLFLVFLNTNKCSMHLLCSSCSSSTSMFDAEKRAVDRAVTCSVNAVPDSPLTLPCLFETIHIFEVLGGLGRKPR
jgi:hypothetical protein